MLFQRPFVPDTSALVNIKNRGHLERLIPLVENTLIQWPPGITREVYKFYEEDELGRWIRRHHYGESELNADETRLFGELIKIYGKPFKHQGQIRKPLSEADAEAVAIAINRGWILLTDDISMQIVCKQYGGNWTSSDDFLHQLGLKKTS